MTDYTDLIAALKAGRMTPKTITDAAIALEAQARRIAELEAALETTKSLLPQKLVDAPYRPPFISDWWSIAVLERRKRRSADKELRARIADFEALTKRLVNVVEFLNATHNSGDARDIIAEARAAYLGEKND
jgi:hypothetical protein